MKIIKNIKVKTLEKGIKLITINDPKTYNSLSTITLNSLLIVRENGITIGRMLASMIIMFQIGTTFSTLRFLFIKRLVIRSDMFFENYSLSLKIISYKNRMF